MRKTKVKDVGQDEMYCRWWRCLSCEEETFEGSNFCPGCGKEIIKPAE